MVTSPIGLARQTTALVVRDVLESRPARGGAVELRSSDVRDPAARDLFASKLPAEYERRQDHHLGHRVMALDIGGRVALGQAGRLRLGECVVVGAAFIHPGEDEVGGRIEQTPERYRDRSRQTVDQRAEHRRAGHDGRLGAKRHPAPARQARELHSAQGDRPFV
jgi:hypothetical protein